MPYLLFAFVSITWSTSFLLMKKSSLAFAPASVAALRVATGGLVLAAIALALRQRWRPGRDRLIALALITLCGYVWPYFIQPYVITRAGSGFMGVMIGLGPILTVVLSLPILGVVPTTRQIIGVAGGMACLVVLGWDGLHRDLALLDVALAASVQVGYALSSNLVKRWFVDAPSLSLTAWCLAGSTLALTPIAVAHDTVRSGDLGLALASVAALGVLCTGLTGFAFYWLILRRGPLFAGMSSYLIPIGALVLGWMDGEIVTPRQVAALLGILTMVLLVQLPSRMATAAPEVI
jgi:drug/metabolite transporter (DMT)-like permease